MRDLMTRGADLTEIYVPSPFQLLVAGCFKDVHAVSFSASYSTMKRSLPGDASRLRATSARQNAIHLEDFWRRAWRGKPPRSQVTAVNCIDCLPAAADVLR